MRTLRFGLVAAAVLPALVAAGCYVNRYSSDPKKRTQELLEAPAEPPTTKTRSQPAWLTDQPSHLTPERVHGAIAIEGTASGAAGEAGPPQPAPAEPGGRPGRTLQPQTGAEPSQPAPSQPPPSQPAPPEPGPGDAEARYVRELLAVLKETRSADCFVVTLGLLRSTDVDPREAVPLILRNAERLGLLAGTVAPSGEQTFGVLAVFETVSKLHEQRRGQAAAAGAGVAAACPRMGITTPVPVPPWVTERVEEKYQGKSDRRTPILPPIQEGSPPPVCDDPPDDTEMLRALPAVRRGVPGFCEERRENVQVITERVLDKIDPPRSFPLIGPAQLHHCRWKCSVWFDEVVESQYPFPFRVKKPRKEVVFLDRDALHLYSGPGAGAGTTGSPEPSGTEAGGRK